jgi:hypothetical protein
VRDAFFSSPWTRLRRCCKQRILPPFSFPKPYFSLLLAHPVLFAQQFGNRACVAFKVGKMLVAKLTEINMANAVASDSFDAR